MSRTEGCTQCWFRCKFELESGYWAGEVERRTTTPENASVQIEQLRIQARMWGCRNLNDIDPDFEGKSDL